MFYSLEKRKWNNDFPGKKLKTHNVFFFQEINLLIHKKFKKYIWNIKQNIHKERAKNDWNNFFGWYTCTYINTMLCCFDERINERNLCLLFQDNGSPPLASQTYLVIDIRDGDDLNPTFTEELYTTQIQEDYPITVGISPILWVSRLICMLHDG